MVDAMFAYHPIAARLTGPLAGWSRMLRSVHGQAVSRVLCNVLGSLLRLKVAAAHMVSLNFRAQSRRALQTLRLVRLSAFSFSPQAVVSTR